jgi:hypothetical protein
MRYVPLNEYLTSESSWPKRLLGWENHAISRNELAVTSEYDKDRYLPLLSLGATHPEDYKVAEFANLGMQLDDPMFISVGNEVFSASLREARLLWYSLIRSYVERFAAGPICELGCGYGFNLTYLGRDAYGGEYSANAVALARRLGLDVASFNYYQLQDYEIVRPGSSIVTVHSIEQIPSVLPIMEHLRRQKSRIRMVINLEPCWLDERQTLLGLVRNRYNQLIDHNHDLIEQLRKAPDVEIVHFEADVFGMHPLNSTNVVVWRFTD